MNLLNHTQTNNIHDITDEIEERTNLNVPFSYNYTIETTQNRQP